MKYYAYIDGDQQGPFDLEDLVKAGVRPSTYIWSKEMDDWHRADEVEEVRELFRRHLSNASTQRETATVDTQEPTQRDYPSRQHPDEPDLSDIPQSYRGFVRKSGTVPGPSNSLEPDINQPPMISMTLAVVSMILCLWPAGIVAVVYTYKSQKAWNEAMVLQQRGENADELKRKAHEFARLSKMWIGLTVALGIIAWTLIFSIR